MNGTDQHAAGSAAGHARSADSQNTGSTGPKHGYGIAERLRQVSEDVLQVGESSLYPALQRLLLNGWVKAEWGASDNNRRARYYTLTAAGRKRLGAEREEFERLVRRHPAGSADGWLADEVRLAAAAHGDRDDNDV